MTDHAKREAWARGVRELRAELAAAVVAVADQARPAGPSAAVVVLSASVIFLAGMALTQRGAH